MIPRARRYPALAPDGDRLYRTCPACAVTWRGPAACWVCSSASADVDHTDHVRNPAGPLPEAVGTALVL